MRGPGLIGLALLLLLARAEAQELTADLSDHLIAISSDFTGADMLVFGTTDGPGDIIVTVRGPRSPVVVREKERAFGIWLNAASMRFDNVPAFYALAASRPPETVMTEDVRRLNEIGLDQLRLVAEPGADDARATAFREALLDLKTREGLYAAEPAKVTFLGDRLFRAAIHFPASVPVGRYAVDVALVQDGHIVRSFSPSLLVHKVGFGADVFDFAYEDAALYGLLAVLGAAMAGFLGSLLFRRP